MYARFRATTAHVAWPPPRPVHQVAVRKASGFRRRSCRARIATESSLAVLRRRTPQRMSIGGNVLGSRAGAGLWAHKGWFFLGLWLALCLLTVAAYLLGE
jgi:hypothetical protein